MITAELWQPEIKDAEKIIFAFFLQKMTPYGKVFKILV